MGSSLVTFRVANELWGVDVGDVLEIVRVGALTRVPGTVDRVVGVIGWRGKTIPVISLTGGLKPDDDAPDLMKRVLILARRGPFGLLIDRPERILHSGEWERAPGEVSLGAEGGEGPTRGLARTEAGLVRILDPDRLLGSEAELVEVGPTAPTHGDERE